MKILYDGHVFVDYGQLWIYDSALDDDDDENLPELLERIPRAASRRLRRLGYEQLESFVMIAARMQWGVHWLQVFLAEKAPRFPPRHDFRVRLPLTLRSSPLHVMVPTDAEPQVRCRVRKGNYWLYVFGYHLTTKASEDQAELAHQGKLPTARNFAGYRIALVPRKS